MTSLLKNTFSYSAEAADAIAVVLTCEGFGRWRTDVRRTVTTRPVAFRHFAQPDLLRTYNAGAGARRMRIKDMMDNEPFLQPPTTAGFA